jgi:hypothetical protein
MRWQVAAASRAGTRHIGLGVGCQDAFQWANLPRPGGEALVVAISDGASGVSRAAEAAALASGVATAVVQEFAHDGLPSEYDIARWQAMMHAVLAWTIVRVADCTELLSSPHRLSLADLSRQRAEGATAHVLSPNDFATTLACVILAPPILSIGSIGSSCVLVRLADDSYHLVTPPLGVRGNPDNEVFLSSQDALSKAQVDCIWEPRITGILAGTDGLAEAILRFPGDIAFPQPARIASLFAAAESMDDLSKDEIVVRASQDDDVTVVAVTRHE